MNQLKNSYSIEMNIFVNLPHGTQNSVPRKAVMMEVSSNYLDENTDQNI